MNNTRSKLTGTIEILAATSIWGYGYVALKTGLEKVPFNVMMSEKYILAFMVMLIFFFKKIKKLSALTWIKGALVGLFLYLSQLFQTLAIYRSDTTVGRVAFLTAIYVIMVPFAKSLILLTAPKIHHVVSATIAVIGLFFLTEATISGLSLGDIYAIIGSVGFTFHILVIDNALKDNDIISIAMIQFAFAAIIGTVVALANRTSFVYDGMWDGMTLWCLFYVGVISTMVGFLMQILGQGNISPELSAVLLATESVFGILFSIVLLGEDISISKAIGCLLMLTAVIISEVGLPGTGKCIKIDN